MEEEIEREFEELVDRKLAPVIERIETLERASLGTQKVLAMLIVRFYSHEAQEQVLAAFKRDKITKTAGLDFITLDASKVAVALDRISKSDDPLSEAFQFRNEIIAEAKKAGGEYKRTS